MGVTLDVLAGPFSVEGIESCNPDARYTVDDVWRAASHIVFVRLCGRYAILKKLRPIPEGIRTEDRVRVFHARFGDEIRPLVEAAFGRAKELSFFKAMSKAVEVADRYIEPGRWPTMPIEEVEGYILDSPSPVPPPSSPTPNPLASEEGLAPFSSCSVVYGAAQAMFNREGWRPDGNDILMRPHYKASFNGPQFKAAIVYQILVPTADCISLADPEFAYSILRDIGPDTAWLHMMLAVYCAQLKSGEEAIIAGEDIERALGLSKRTNITRAEKRRRCFKHIDTLRAISVNIVQASMGGKKILNYLGETFNLWSLKTQLYGQVSLEEGPDNRWTEAYSHWQLVVRPGIWGEDFLFGENSRRQIGWLNREMFERFNRKTSPLATVLIIGLTFEARCQKGPVLLSLRRLLELAGKDPMPSDPRMRYELKQQCKSAVQEAENVGWRVEHLPGFMLPDDAECDAADAIVTWTSNNGSGQDVAPRRAARSSWEATIQERIRFIPPPQVLAEYEKMRSKERHPRPALPPKRKQQESKWTPSVLEAFREGLGLTKAALAQQIGVTGMMVGHLERGKRKFTPQIVQALEALQSNPERLQQIAQLRTSTEKPAMRTAGHSEGALEGIRTA